MSGAARPPLSTPQGKRHAVARLGLAAWLWLSVARASVAGAATSANPIIYSVSATPRIAHAGDAIKWDAHVSPNVVAVTARVAVYSFSLYPLRSGHFGETFVIPKDVPPFFHGHYGVTITATTAAGASTSRSIGLSFQ